MLKRTTPIILLVAVGLAIGAHNPAPVTTPYNPRIDPADFGGPIDNPYLPLKPGTVFRYRGVGDDGTTPELNVVRVTRRTKRIMGIDAVVVLDKVWAHGQARGAHLRLVRPGQAGQRLVHGRGLVTTTSTATGCETTDRGRPAWATASRA